MAGGVVLLAAGSSRRFGSDKRRHRLQGGESLLIASARRYGVAFPRRLVVLRPDDEALAAELARTPGSSGFVPVYCTDARLGMGHSLACGARAAADWSWLFVALADMPWVQPGTLMRLRHAMEGAGSEAVVQPLHGGTPGHPVGFGSRWIPALGRCRGDQGARDVLREAAAQRLLRIEVDDPGVLRDLDRPGQA